jgi:hypothetical protein
MLPFPQLSDHWHLHNLGMAETERTLMFEGPANEPEACFQAGQETCGIVDQPSGVATTVYVNGSSVAAFFAAHGLALDDVGILKIDAGASRLFSLALCVRLLLSGAISPSNFKPSSQGR